MSASPRVNQYERGKHAPDYSMARRLAEALNVPVSYLYTEDDYLAEVVMLFWDLEEEKRGELLEWLRRENSVKP